MDWLTIILGLMISAIAVAVVSPWVIMQLRMMHPKFLDRTRRGPSIATDRILREFRELTFSKPEGSSFNPHKKSAAIRTAAVGFIRSFYLVLGVEEASISMSGRDQRDGLKGIRRYHWGKDTDKKPMYDTANCGHSYVDVDYHVDALENDLAGRSLPTIAFTIIPSRAAKSGETSYTFEKNGAITVNMAGGGSYSHHLWDWTPDTITCSKRFLGIPYCSTIYKVEKRTLDDLKSLVVLAPIGTWVGLGAFLVSRLSSGRLRRFNCVEGDFAHIRYVKQDGLYHSIARLGTHTSSDLTAEEFDSMGTAARISKQEPNTSAMATWVKQNRVQANIAAAFFRQNDGLDGIFVTSIDEAVTTVSANIDKHGDEPERVSVQAFMQPLIAGNCYAHTDHIDNARWAVGARITKVAATSQQQLNPFVAACIHEFVRLCFPSALTASDLDLVYEKQNRPIQRAIIAEAVHMGPSEKTSLKAFLKKEAYAGARDPRIITTYRPGVKVGYSTYMYAITTQMKEHAWYGFKTPEQVAARVAGVCLDSTYVVEGDFSRMDGRVDGNVRNVFERSILNAAFPGDEEVHRLHKLQFGQTVGLSGDVYQQGTARGSGSPETSAFNTALTAFVMFLTMRMLGLDADSAFEHIGIVAGDDSLQQGVEDVPAEKFGKTLEKAARQMGQVLTSDIKMLGEPVQFLSRYFGGAWHGDLNSMSCPLRLLSKVHAAVNIGAVSAEDKCRTKGESILPGDANTPIIGDLARKMTTIGQCLTGDNATRMSSWWTKFADCSWPNEFADWMEDIIQKEMPDFDRRAFDDWIDMGHPLEAPTCLVVDPKPATIDLLIGDSFYSPSVSTGPSVASSGSTTSSRKTNPRRRKKTKNNTPST